jgi:membrane fusion protein, multidrug efflux system
MRILLPKWVFALLTTTLLFGCKQNKKNAAAPPVKAPLKADVFIVTASALSNNIDVPGSLTAFEETNLQPEISGRVTAINFKEGSAVAAGAVMVKLYDADLQAQLKKLEVQQAIAQKTEERQAELLKISGISQQDYDLSLLAVKNLDADIDILKTSIAKTSLRAPFNGIAGLRNISLGAYITPATVVTTIRQLNQLKLSFTVPEKYSSLVLPGTLVQFKINGDKANYPAIIIATENDVDETSRSMRVKATVTRHTNKLFAGAFAQVQLSVDRNQTAMMIPTQAVIPQARSKKVMVLRNGLAVLETIETGVRDTAMVEIVNGLKLGDTVLISGLLATKPGTSVNVGAVKQ